MKTDMDKQLKRFFNEEVRLRQEPQVRVRGNRLANGIFPLLIRLGTVAACLLLLWGTTYFRKEHSLDGFIPHRQVQTSLMKAFDTGSFVIEIALIGEQ